MITLRLSEHELNLIRAALRKRSASFITRLNNCRNQLDRGRNLNEVLEITATTKDKLYENELLKSQLEQITAEKNLREQNTQMIQQRLTTVSQFVLFCKENKIDVPSMMIGKFLSKKQNYLE